MLFTIAAGSHNLPAPCPPNATDSGPQPMMDFQIKRSSRRCHATERQLQPGEEFVSELVSGGSGFERHDYCLDAWSGPGEGSVGWWRGRVPTADASKVYWAPAPVLREYFEQLVKSPDHREAAWVMAMLLVRRRLMRLEHEESGDDGHPWIVVTDNQSKQEHRVMVVPLDQAQQQAIQQDFAEQLFTDQPSA